MRRILPLCALLLACETQAREEAVVPADTAVPASPAGDAAGADTDALTTLDCATFLETALRAAPARAELHEAFGAPDSVRAWTEANRHVPDVLDSLFVVHYAGLQLEIRRPHGGLDMADLALVSDNRYLARGGIGIGAPAERVVAVLGEPAERTPDRLRYECGETGAPVMFLLARGVVTGLELDYYVD